MIEDLNLILWAKENSATSALIRMLDNFGYKVSLHLSGSDEPVVERGRWFYEGRDNIVYQLTCGRTPVV